MKVQLVCMIVACTVMVDGQTGSSPAHKADEKQPAAGLYQRQAATRAHEQKDDFFTASTKLVNKNDFDYGAMLERRRQAFLDASAANPFFWYSALTTGLLMVLMLAYGVRVMMRNGNSGAPPKFLTTCGTMHSTRARWLRRRSRNTTGTWRNATG
jgi:hypothetical protein